MTVHEYFMNAIQDDARRAGERDRLLLEARRAHKARRQYMVPVAQARHRTEIGKIVVSSNVRHQALTAGTFLLGRRSYEWLVGVLALSQHHPVERLISSSWREGNHGNEDAAAPLRGLNERFQGECCG